MGHPAEWEIISLTRIAQFNPAAVLSLSEEWRIDYVSYNVTEDKHPTNDYLRRSFSIRGLPASHVKDPAPSTQGTFWLTNSLSE